MDEQEKFWTVTYGKEFATRWDQTVAEQDEYSLKMVGTGKLAIYKDALANLPIRRIMEVGCNAGLQLRTVEQALGEGKSYWGIEPFEEAITISHKYPDLLNIIHADCYDIPFKDGFFDLVFTHCVLIHISPENLPAALKEIYRCSGRYILGYEYYSPDLQEVTYRNFSNVMWKGDYARMYQEAFPGLKMIYSKFYEYFESAYGQKGLLDHVFVLEKT